MPRPPHAGIGILHRDHGACDTCGDDRLCAARLPVGVRTGLEVDVDRPAAGARTGGYQCDHLRVVLPLGVVVALTGHVARGVDHDRPHHRVGAGAIVREARELEGARGPLHVGGLVAG